MALTIEHAQTIVKDYYDLKNPSEEEDFLFVEALEYLIYETNQSRYMMELGAWYYGRKQFDLAEEYYLKAAELKDIDAYQCLGYIYYYGRVGKPDYKKAYTYYKLASDAGDLIATYKMADMYRNGYYVQKDVDRYVSIIKSLYPKIKDATNVFAPLPEIYSRLARIYKKEGKVDEAIKILLYAKDFQAQRLIYNGFFGDLSIMKSIVFDLYQLIEFDFNHVDLFDLYYLLRLPATLVLCINQEEHLVESKVEDQMVYITMDGKNFENVDEFFSHAKIQNERLSAQYLNIDYVEVRSWKSLNPSI